jgi:hypothetical protein
MIFLLLACAEPDSECSCPSVASSTVESPTSDSGTSPTSPAPALWAPPPETSWQWQLTGAIDTSYDVAAYDIDLFDAPQAVIDELHGDGRVVICYFSAGSYEDFRSDADQYPQAAIGEPLDDWPGEWWVDIRSDAVRDILRARLDLAVATSCDAVEPDNVDGWANDTGFPLTRADQLDFNTFLATEAHARGLSVGLKNAVELTNDLVEVFDWSLNEECLQYDECTALRPFIEADKAVFHVEYVNRSAQGPDLADEVCGDPTIAGFSTLIKTWDLDAWQLACP